MRVDEWAFEGLGNGLQKGGAVGGCTTLLGPLDAEGTEDR